MSLLSDVTRETLTPGPSSSSKARDGRSDGVADQRRLDAVGGQSVDQFLARRVSEGAIQSLVARAL